MKKFFEEERRKQIIAIAIFIASVVVATYVLMEVISPQKKKESEPLAEIKIEEKTMEKEAFRKRYGEKLIELERKLKKMERELGKLREENKKLKQQLKERKVAVKEETEPLRKNIITGKPLPPPPPPNQIITSPPPPALSLYQRQDRKRIEELKNLIVIDKEREEEPRKEKITELKKKPSKSVIPAGAFVKGVLLSGIDAPTVGKAQTSPHPVLIRIVDKAILPNLWKADIKDCFVIGAAYGDLSAERAYIRLETLSCVRKDGTAITKSVDGYVAGEDGKVGLAGRVVTKQGQILARTLLAGFVEGVAKAFGTSQTTVSVSPQGAVTTIQPGATTQVAIASGISKAAEKLAEFYIKLANEMYPVVEINAGRNVDLVFLRPIVFGEETQVVQKGGKQ